MELAELDGSEVMVTVGIISSSTSGNVGTGVSVGRVSGVDTSDQEIEVPVANISDQEVEVPVVDVSDQEVEVLDVVVVEVKVEVKVEVEDVVELKAAARQSGAVSFLTQSVL